MGFEPTTSYLGENACDYAYMRRVYIMPDVYTREE